MKNKKVNKIVKEGLEILDCLMLNPDLLIMKKYKELSQKPIIESTKFIDKVVKQGTKASFIDVCVAQKIASAFPIKQDRNY